MDRYQRVEKPRPESAINENEIRITSQGLIRNYISYATSLLQYILLMNIKFHNQEKRVREIMLKAMGQAINKAVALAEILKNRIPGMHQDTSIGSVSITDVWEPIEEGLVPLEMTRHVSMISISLSTRPLNKNSPGYQTPLHVVQPKIQKYQQSQQYQQQHMPRQPPAQYNDGMDLFIHMVEGVVEVEEEEGAGAEVVMVAMVIMEDMEVMEDMKDMEDMGIIKKMVDGIITGIKAVVVVEEAGVIVLLVMNEEEEVEGEAMAEEGAGWVAVGEEIKLNKNVVMGSLFQSVLAFLYGHWAVKG
ncbi:hypothetical protein IEQ34_021195 [Dendrobium chrysotoxum]|uniref:DNA/RNA-binding protein Alba-like domain-containing protein n=1 Tax=Dendrobium chrysotoxum TaxID=161865 RepID=A0AAV7G4C1_DENCH|nr:hypothetical protein IEQ34_021195 [Dendrobium chrysotoxum]